MLESLYIASTGMHAEQTHLNAISNNLANLNTTAYKKSSVHFSDLLYIDNYQSSSHLSQTLGSVKRGLGTSVAAMNKDFSIGDLKGTGNPMHLAIRGQGFFEVDVGNGTSAYTRNGNFKIDEEGFIATVDGFRLMPNIQIPPDATEVVITKNGVVQAQLQEGDDLMELGQIELANFVNVTGLEPLGNGLYGETDASGVPGFTKPNEFGVGDLAQGYLEASNVDLVTELLELVIAQRGYEVNSQVIRATDEMLKIGNNLRS